MPKVSVYREQQGSGKETRKVLLTLPSFFFIILVHYMSFVIKITLAFVCVLTQIVMFYFLRNHNPSSLLPCEYCPYKARDRSRLKRHQRAVHKAKKGEKKILVITLYTCCICATEFSRERDLTRHIKSYHPYGV